ncbi:MAG TPA: SsrA-binding protein SmpB [Candidatus Saccharimonadales bacterium]|nr:SsrA-binding protein SmpB [Candidatus Saccharimonadales bacterium]
MAKKQPEALVINRRARHDYDIRDQFSVGIALTGAEVKAARSGQVSLKGSYVTIKAGELWLINASFSVLHSRPGHSERTVDTGARKLLAKKREIAMLQEAKDQGLTIVPLSMTTRTRFIKLTITTAKGRKKYDKREAIKKRDIERENKRMLATRAG